MQQVRELDAQSGNARTPRISRELLRACIFGRGPGLIVAMTEFLQIDSLDRVLPGLSILRDAPCQRGESRGETGVVASRSQVSDVRFDRRIGGRVVDSRGFVPYVQMMLSIPISD